MPKYIVSYVCPITKFVMPCVINFGVFSGITISINAAMLNNILFIILDFYPNDAFT